MAENQVESRSVQAHSPSTAWFCLSILRELIWQLFLIFQLLSALFMMRAICVVITLREGEYMNLFFFPDIKFAYYNGIFFYSNSVLLLGTFLAARLRHFLKIDPNYLWSCLNFTVLWGSATLLLSILEQRDKSIFVISNIFMAIVGWLSIILFVWGTILFGERKVKEELKPEKEIVRKNEMDYNWDYEIMLMEENENTRQTDMERVTRI